MTDKCRLEYSSYRNMAHMQKDIDKMRFIISIALDALGQISDYSTDMNGFVGPLSRETMSKISELMVKIPSK